MSATSFAEESLACSVPEATIKKVTKENWKELIMDGGRKTHLVVFMMDPSCVECRRRQATLSQDLAFEL
jgi:thioredoxin-like negative regulator of GroEL